MRRFFTSVWFPLVLVSLSAAGANYLNVMVWYRLESTARELDRVSERLGSEAFTQSREIRDLRDTTTHRLDDPQESLTAQAKRIDELVFKASDDDIRIKAADAAIKVAESDIDELRDQAKTQGAVNRAHTAERERDLENHAAEMRALQERIEKLEKASA